MKKKNRNWFRNLAAAFRRAAGARRKIQNRHTKGGRMGWGLQGLGGGAKKETNRAVYGDGGTETTGLPQLWKSSKND
jgi:hypothetical protein